MVLSVALRFIESSFASLLLSIYQDGFLHIYVIIVDDSMLLANSVYLLLEFVLLSTVLPTFGL